MKIKKIYLVFISLLMLGSCEKYLDLDPIAELGYDAAFSTVADAENATRGIYEAMHENDGYYSGQQLLIPDVMADNLTLCSEGRLTFNLINNWDIKSGNSAVENLFAQAYVVINRCNNVILRSANSSLELEDDQKILDHILGEAYAIRAMVYFDLVRFYGVTYTKASVNDLGVPYVTDPLPSMPSRNTVQECYANILSDIVIADTLLRKGEISSDVSISRFSSIALKALEARIYLTMGRWQDAITKATEVISVTPDIASIADFPEVWRDASVEGVIFKVVMTDADNARTTSGSNIGTYYNQSSSAGVRSEYVCSFDLFNLYATTDIRGATWIETSEFAGKSFNHILKYKQKDGVSSKDVVDAKVFRVEEMYLTRAEAYLNLATPNETAALADLDVVRLQRYDGFASGNETGQALIAAVDLERRLEFAFEGHRWFDLKRKNLPVVRGDYGDESDGGGLKPLVLRLEANSPYWLWPIPTFEMDANPNMIQNEY